MYVNSPSLLSISPVGGPFAVFALAEVGKNHRHRRDDEVDRACKRHGVRTHVRSGGGCGSHPQSQNKSVAPVGSGSKGSGLVETRRETKNKQTVHV